MGEGGSGIQRFHPSLLPIHCAIPVTESQNHRIVGVGRDLCGSSSPTLLPEQGHLQQAAQDLVQAGSPCSSMASCAGGKEVAELRKGALLGERSRARVG